MNAIVTIKNDNLPVRAKRKVANAFAAVVSSGFDLLSIKSKVFTIVSGDIKTLVTKADDPDTPASHVEVIILATNPHKSKVYYKGGYTEGATDKPLCYSNNGLTPELDSAEPQAKKCATCPHAVFGSKITENGKKAKACSDSLRLALIAGDLTGNPMMLRVPAASLALLGKYGSFLADKGYEPHEVVTRIGFDYTVAYPALTFKAVGFVEEGSEFASQVAELRASEVVQQIIGTIPTESAVEEGEPFVPPPKAEEKVAKAAPADDLPAAPKAKVKVETPAPAAVIEDDLPAAPKAKVKVESVKPVQEDAAAELATLVDSVDDLDFDD